MYIIVGLGNPGRKYAGTRHNIGFMVLDNYLKGSSWQKKFNALYTTEIINNEKVIFVKPETYMNLSGNSVIEFINFYKIEYKNILVIHDDLDLPFGKIRVKTNSSAGGHNGIKSIINRIGKFNKEQLAQLEKTFILTNQIIEDFINYDINKVMNDYNGVG